MEDRERMAALDLPDEAEYPRQLSEKYELVECFSAQDDAQTLLARDRAEEVLRDMIAAVCGSDVTVKFEHRYN